jgi:hypothetical protein
MSDEPLFSDADEQETLYAPNQLPAERQARVRADEGTNADNTDRTEPPAAAPVASVGTTPTGQAAPPNIGQRDSSGAPGDPDPEARYPIGDDHDDPR